MLPSANRRLLTFEQKKKTLENQSVLCTAKNMFITIIISVILLIFCVFCILYFDVVSHATIDHQSSANNNIDIDINNKPIISGDINKLPFSPPNMLHSSSSSTNNDLSITSQTAYMTDDKLDISNKNFINLLHRRSLGFDVNEYKLMNEIISEYGKFHNFMIENDVNSNKLNGKYIILNPGAQLCNRLRALMGTLLLGIVTKRVIFIDIAAEGYAARLDGIFLNPGFKWEYHKLPSSLKSLINTGGSTQRMTFPYEWFERQKNWIKEAKAVPGIQSKQICENFMNGKHVWMVDSMAAYLPLMARNENIYKTILNNHNKHDKWSFDYKFVSHFMGQIEKSGQEFIENLEVLLGRIVFKLEQPIQDSVDNIVQQTYDKAVKYYKNAGLNSIDSNLPPPVIGIHIRSEYVISMNAHICRNNVYQCDKPYKWFEDCGIVAMDIDDNDRLNGIKPFLFIAADTPDAQKMANQMFGEERVYFRKFDQTGSSLQGIKEAVIDLVTVGSFDVFVGTPHSSYSEMSSILGQPRRLYDVDKNEYYFKWNIDNNDNNMIPVNRMIIPIMTTEGWEINKLNLYTVGRTIDINLSDENKLLLPYTSEQCANTQFYQNNRVCKQSITAGMGWMAMFNVMKNVHCYNEKWHHPGKWFPIADK